MTSTLIDFSTFPHDRVLIRRALCVVLVLRLIIVGCAAGCPRSFSSSSALAIVLVCPRPRLPSSSSALVLVCPRPRLPSSSSALTSLYVLVCCSLVAALPHALLWVTVGCCASGCCATGCCAAGCCASGCCAHGRRAHGRRAHGRRALLVACSWLLLVSG